jgi:cell filamentation protein
MSDDPYVYPGTKVLINTLNIRDKNQLQQIEDDYSSIRLTQLYQKSLPGKFDYQHLQKLHRFIFQDIYPWAGEPRTIGLHKPEVLLDGCSVNYPHPDHPFPPDNLQARADHIFGELKKANYLKNLPTDRFVNSLAHHATEIWELHPFREGNTRTTLSFVMALSKKSGHEMNYVFTRNLKEVRDAFVLATKNSKAPIMAFFRTGIGVNTE